MQGIPGVFTVSTVRREAPERRATSAAGLVGAAERGPLNSPQPVLSFRDYQEVFGGERVEFHLPAAVRSFFANGGRKCYVVRAGHPIDAGGAPRASRYEIRDSDGAVALRLEAASPGVWGDALEIGFERDPSWTAVGTMRATNAGLREVELDRSRDLFAGARVRFQLAGAPIVEGEVEAVLSPTRVRLVATLATPMPEGTPLLARLLTLRVATNDRAELFKAVSLDPDHPRFVGLVVNGEHGVSWPERAARGHSLLVRAEVELRASEAPLPSVDVPGTATDLVLLVLGGLDPVLPMDARYFVGYDGAAYFPFADPFTLGFSGVASLEPIHEIALVAVPDLGRIPASPTRIDQYIAAQHRVLDHCASHGERFALLEPPDWLFDEPDLAASLEDYQLRLRASGAPDFGAVYFPWTVTRSGSRPPSGGIAGVYSRTDESEGTHRAPANETLVDAIGLNIAVGDGWHARLRDLQLNCLRVFAGRGVTVWGAHTLSVDFLLKQVSVRRTLLLIRRELRRALAWATFEPRTPELARAIGASVRSYLLGLFRNGILTGTLPEEAFSLALDTAETELTFRIGLALVRPAEFIIVRVRQRASGVEVTD
jgi:uncharacterized protein